MIGLIGNGINRVETNYSWETMIESLLQNYGEGINRRNKPFNLLYEEIVSMAIKNSIDVNEQNVLRYIASEVKSIQCNEFHKQALKKYSKVISTNYDYAFENSLGIKDIDTHTKEIRYNLYRYSKIENNLIWHIHGEVNKPNTLCIGYEHYSANIQIMRNYINTNRKYFLDKDPPKTYSESWLKYILCDDIDIIGLDLSFLEIDLWWLLIYRSRNINRNKKTPVNKINYLVKKCKYSEKDIEKLEMLKANNIFVHEIDVNTYKEYYEEVFRI